MNYNEFSRLENGLQEAMINLMCEKLLEKYLNKDEVYSITWDLFEEFGINAKNLKCDYDFYTNNYCCKLTFTNREMDFKKLINNMFQNCVITHSEYISLTEKLLYEPQIEFSVTVTKEFNKLANILISVSRADEIVMYILELSLDDYLNNIFEFIIFDINKIRDNLTTNVNYEDIFKLYESTNNVIDIYNSVKGAENVNV